MLYRVFPNSMTEAADLRGAFAGEWLFLIAPGPSLAETDLAPLNRRGIVTLGLNTSYLIYRPTIWLGLDAPECFPPLVYQDPGVTKISRASLAHVTWRGKQLCEYPNILFLHLGGGDSGPLFAEPARWYPKTFIAAVQLAWCLGFSRVCTVGTDFAIDRDRQYAWGNPLSAKYVATNRGIYANTLTILRRVLPDLTARGVTLVNTTPGSRLDFVPFLPLARAVEEALESKEMTVNPDALLHSMEVLRLRRGGFRLTAPSQKPSAADRARSLREAFLRRAGST